MLGVVFVHGLGSSAGMWDGFGALLAGDGGLSGVVGEPVSRFEYASGRVQGLVGVLPSIATVADSLKTFLEVEAGGFEGLVLVGHGVGGLVVQRWLVRMLAEGRGRELVRIRRVVLLATPTLGSDVVSCLGRVLVRGNPQVRELRLFDEALADAVQVMQRSIVNAGPVASASSCRIPVSAFAAESDGVVSRASAQVFAGSAVLPGTHSSVARPDSPRHRTYTTVRRLLLEAAAGMVDTVLSLGPARLEVHNAADAGAAVGESDRVPVLTRYLPRAHDRRVRAVLGEVLAGGPSRLVMLTGESSTGKTRALYEALLDLAPSAPLLHPVGDLDLLELLDEGRVRSGCVVWLNEAQRFLYNRDAAARLRAVMTATPGIAAVGTLWNNPYWNDLTTSDNSDGPRSQAKALLTHPALAVRINVPAHLDAEDLNGWRKLARTSGDPRLQQALSAGAGDGKVIQYVSGGPELLTAYLTGDRGGALFTAAEHALITVALDARRLGHRGPLPAALLTDAADGSLSTRDRSPDPRWAEHALRALSSGRREDGSRADVRNTLTALTAVYARSGAPAAYEPPTISTSTPDAYVPNSTEPRRCGTP
ncbi:hypothetical protein ACFQ9X_27095 [Catenulispora yoronensis]